MIWTRVDSFPAEPDNGVGVLAVLPMPGSGTATADAHPVTRDVYAVASAKDGGLSRSPDGGATWERVAKQPRGLCYHEHRARLGRRGRVYVGTEGRGIWAASRRRVSRSPEALHWTLARRPRPPT